MAQASYRHRIIGQADSILPTGKVVCIGRNYAEHARELNNPIPKTPILFMKPATALVPFGPDFSIPADSGSVHHELEMALLVGSSLHKDEPGNYLHAIAGVGLAIDLTLRDIQSQLKEKGQPWEVAKAFDGSCPCSAFVAASQFTDLQNIELELQRNGVTQQIGNTGDMIFPVAELLASICKHFSLQAGDVVLTGTPAGVGPLQAGDQLTARLGNYLQVESSVS
jgi:2-keto-4-pentenoate hydratase/2-oxohepta-3-ene-1,7-dioic acid hydratase in catechol pathway